MPFMKNYSIIILFTDESRSVLSNATSFLGVIPSPSQSTAQTRHSHTNVFITAVCASAGFLLMLLVVILVTTVLLLGRQKQKRGIITFVLHGIVVEFCIHLHAFPDDSTVTDHIPVDDNPVYITIKKINMNKNSAYEMVHLETNMH